jgi:YkoY family integral membrane protein
MRDISIHLRSVQDLMQFIIGYTGPDLRQAFVIILNLILIESLLSIDNAAVLATLVMDLPDDQRKRALRIGIVFAYVFRGAALLFAGVLMRITWLKLVGGGYLVYLSVDYFIKRSRASQNAHTPDKHIVNNRQIGTLSPFWSTVLMVEMMDLTFSIDNVFAAVAFTNRLALVCLGVFIGIIAMRVVAGYFVRLMTRFPFLESISFIIVGLLGIKLCLSFVATYWTDSILATIDHSQVDLYFSLLTISLFVVPICWSLVTQRIKSK